MTESAGFCAPEGQPSLAHGGSQTYLHKSHAPARTPRKTGPLRVRDDRFWPVQAGILRCVVTFGGSRGHEWPRSLPKPRQGRPSSGSSAPTGAQDRFCSPISHGFRRGLATVAPTGARGLPPQGLQTPGTLNQGHAAPTPACTALRINSSRTSLRSMIGVENT